MPPGSLDRPDSPAEGITNNVLSEPNGRAPVVTENVTTPENLESSKLTANTSENHYCSDAGRQASLTSRENLYPSPEKLDRSDEGAEPGDVRRTVRRTATPPHRDHDGTAAPDASTDRSHEPRGNHLLDTGLDSSATLDRLIRTREAASAAGQWEIVKALTEEIRSLTLASVENVVDIAAKTRRRS